MYSTVQFSTVPASPSAHLCHPQAILESGERKLEAGKVTVPAVTLDETAERAVFSLGPEEAELAPGPAVLFLEYTGVLNNDMIGFYRKYNTVL